MDTEQVQNGMLSIGWAQANITPDMNVMLAGQHHARISEGIKDPVTATALALKEEKFKKLITRLDCEDIVDLLPLPGLVRFAENLTFDSPAVIEYLKDELSRFDLSQYQTVVLGCTHYPLLMNVISDIMGNDVTLVDPGAETAEYLASELMLRGMLAEKTAPGLCRCFVTDSTDDFYASAELFLGRGIISEVEQVEL
mgnify:CR=1 FL=1